MTAGEITKRTKMSLALRSKPFVPTFVRLANFSASPKRTALLLRHARFIKAAEHIAKSRSMHQSVQPYLFRMKRRLVLVLLHPHAQRLDGHCSRVEVLLRKLHCAKRRLEAQLTLGTSANPCTTFSRELSSSSIRFLFKVPVQVSIWLTSGFLQVKCYEQANVIIASLKNYTNEMLIIENLLVPFVETRHLPVLLVKPSTRARGTNAVPTIKVIADAPCCAERNHLVLSFVVVLM